MAESEKPIIIIKKKGGHGGHHGGAWKVAYADFVTAMMAFFMVMWLLNTAEVQTRKAIAYYFRKPGWLHQSSGSPFGADGVGLLSEAYGPPNRQRSSSGEKWEVLKKRKTAEEPLENTSHREKPYMRGLSPTKLKNNDPNGVSVARESEEINFSSPTEQLGPLGPDSVGDSDHYRALTDTGETPDAAGLNQKDNTSEAESVFENIKEEIAQNPELKELLGDVEVRMDPEGITLEVMDTERASMFAPASTKILPRAERAFSGIVNLLRPLPHPIEVIGHTDATPFASFPRAMSNWDLSALRANEARKILESNGFPEARVISVIGKADRDLRFPERPFAAGNRRITVRLKFNDGRTNAPTASEDMIPDAPLVRPTVAVTAGSSTPSATSQARSIPSQSVSLMPIPTARPTPPIPRSAPTRSPQTPLPRVTSSPRSSLRGGPQTDTPSTLMDSFPVIKPGQLAKERM